MMIMKKIAMVFVTLLLSVAANAQFEKGKYYVGASLSGLDLSSQAREFHLGIDAKCGYTFMDNLMLTGQLSYNHLSGSRDSYSLAGGVRYYIEQNGIYLGASARYKHAYEYNDFLPGVQIGYAFFLSRTVTLEPELYMDFSTKDFDYSCYGLRIGIGIYL